MKLKNLKVFALLSFFLVFISCVKSEKERKAKYNELAKINKQIIQLNAKQSQLLSEFKKKMSELNEIYLQLQQNQKRMDSFLNIQKMKLEIHTADVKTQFWKNKRAKIALAVVAALITILILYVIIMKMKSESEEVFSVMEEKSEEKEGENLKEEMTEEKEKVNEANVKKETISADQDKK